MEAFPAHATPFFLSPGGLIIQKATANMAYVATNRNHTEVNSNFTGKELQALQANSTYAKPYHHFTQQVKGLSVDQIKHNYDIKGTGKIKSDFSAQGPSAKEDFRFIGDPGNPGVVVDMRHFFVIGGSFSSKTGSETFGLAVEIIQDLGAQQSAYDIQDYYSNQLGAEFFNNFFDKKSDKLPSDQLDDFFKQREQQYQKLQKNEDRNE